MKSQDNTEFMSIGAFRMVGYGLLIFAIVDWLSILFPVRWLDAAWTFNSVGAIIERVAVPLLALALIFVGDTNLRQRWEKVAVRLLSWGSLAASIVFLLMVPLILVMTLRLNVQNNAQLNNQVSTQINQIQQLEQRVGSASSQDLATLLQNINRQGNAAPNVNSPTALKSQLLTEVEQLRNNVKSQADTVRSTQSTALYKSAAKWSIGAFVSSILFFGLWRYSGWSRRKRRTGLRAANVNG
ncbi:MAG: HpsJ family protein [Plectolyngbya sp. WJT66-NPBG17]|jgi:large-conductance mechanosensitive channel|nr:HpsJ family protein [Plectolyngbya sp. WJT66-NPBG17]